VHAGSKVLEVAMLSRFHGPAGKKELSRLLAEQKLFVECPKAAAALVDLLEVSEYPKGKQIYAEGETYRAVIYLIFSGQVELSRGGKLLALMRRGDFIGEFPLLDAISQYSVTAVAAEPACVATLPWHDFEAWAATEPKTWFNMSKELALRLRGAPPSPKSQAPDPPKGPLDALVRGVWLTYWELPAAWRISLAALAVLVALLGIGLGWVWTHLPDSSRTHLLRKIDLEPAQGAASALKQ
jgi:hypothetical protein